MSATGPYADLVNAPPDTEIVGRKIVAFDEIDSTNSHALDHGEHGTVFVADRQTAGRGRLGRTWHSAPGLGLWFTVALDGFWEGLTFAAALAVRDALSSRCALRVKWPNDLLFGEKKVCGILAEFREGRTALGIGLNVHHALEDFPPELQDKAGSLQSELGGTWDRCAILRDVLTHLDGKVMLIRDHELESIHAEWAEACNIVGRRIECGAHRGMVTAIDPKGALIMDTPEGMQTIHSGDVTYLNGD